MHKGCHRSFPSLLQGQVTPSQLLSTRTKFTSEIFSTVAVPQLQYFNIACTQSRPTKMADIKPPFTAETALKKVKAAQNMWNTQEPEKVALAYTPDCIWRNRISFFSGTEKIVEFLTAKWNREKNYRLRKELFAFSDDRIAVQFWYEYQDADDELRWKRCYGLEDWTFDWETGKMCKRMMSGNDMLLGEDGNGEGRWFVEGVDVNEVAISSKHW